MKTTLIKSIITLSIQSRHGNITDYALYRHLGVESHIIASALNALYKDNLITVKTVRDFKLISPTPKAFKLYPSARPVSKEACMIVFKTILELQDSNKSFYNASHISLYRKCATRVGVVTFVNAINKLIQAGYIQSSHPTEKLITYTATKKGVEMYVRAVNNPTPVQVKGNTKRVFSESEQQQQSLLKELSTYTYVIKKHDRKLKAYPAYVFSARELITYTQACESANKLYAQLNLA